MRNVLVVIALILLFSSYEILLCLSRLLPPGRALEVNERLFKRAAHQVFILMGKYSKVTLELENPSGLELPERFLLLTNHQSLMDIPVFIEVLPGRMLRFVAKRELGTGIPFVSTILRRQGHALIKRDGDATQSMRTILRFARRCEAEGGCPVVFPEGTRSRDGFVGSFHTAGVRKVLAETPLPIVVAVIDGGWRIARVKALFKNLRGVKFRVRIVAVTGTLGAKREVLDAIASARERIVAALAAMREEEGPSSQPCLGRK